MPSEHWQTLTSSHFKIHFLPDNRIDAERSAFIAEKLYGQLALKLNWQPKESISMVVIDEHDLANGSATPFPFNRVILRLSPPDTISSLDDYDDWLTVLIEHELTHIFHTDKGRGKILRLRDTFGRFLLFFPNILQPAWLIEGLATHYETHRGIGRGQSSSFEMLMRAEVQRGVMPLGQVNLPPDTQPLSRHYLYGVYFYQFLQKNYGDVAINALIENYSDNFLPFAINSNVKEVFGKNLKQLWSEFTVYLQQRFGEQLKRLQKKSPVTGLKLRDEYFRATALQQRRDGSIIYILDSGEDEPVLVSYLNGNLTQLTTVHPLSELALNRNTDVIYLAQPEVCDEYQLFYDLYRYDIKTDRLQRLTTCQRYKHIAVNPETGQLAAVKTISSIPIIDLLDQHGKKIKSLWQGEYGDVVSQIDWSASRQRLLVSIKHLNKSWSIKEYNLHDEKWYPVIAEPSLNMNARYTTSADGFVYASDETGVMNIYRYDFDTESSQVLSHVLTGAFNPLPTLENDVVYLHYSAEGYQLYRLNGDTADPVDYKKAVELEPRYLTDTNTHQIDSDKYKVSGYSPWPDLWPKYWLPYLIVQDKGSEFGFSTSAVDSLDQHYYELLVGLGVDQKEITGQFYYQYQNWLSLFSSKENTVYSDAIGDTTLIRANTQQQIILTKPITSLKQQWQFKLALIQNQDKDTYRANGVSGFNPANDGLLGVGIYFNNTRQYLKSHSPESGRDVLLVSETSDQFESDYSGRLTTLDWREFFRPAQHHVLALRYVRGESDHTMRPYELGGLYTRWDELTLFNPVYSRKIFNKRVFALRGYQANSQSGQNLELLSLEYRFPLQQVERGIMAPPIGLIKHSGRLFTEAGASWDNGAARSSIQSAGIEWVFDTNLFYFVNLQMRAGYAKALDEPKDEVYYFKLGTAF